MAIVYTYPLKSNPTSSDLLLISDVDDKKRTKNITISEFNRVVSGVVSVNNAAGILTITAGAGIQVDTQGNDIEITNTEDGLSGGIIDRIPLWTSAATLGSSSLKQETVGGGVFQVGTLSSVYIGKDSGTSVNPTVPTQTMLNVGIGDQSLQNFVQGVSSTGSNTSGKNVAVGHDSLTALINGTSNVSVGESSLKALTFGANNVAIGRQSLESLTGLRDVNLSNIAIGTQSLLSLASGSGNISIGTSNFDTTTILENSTSLGFRAGKNFTGSANSSILIGVDALGDNNPNSAIESIIIGKNSALNAQGNLDNDILIGSTVFLNAESAGSNIAIGSRANAASGSSTPVTGSIAIGTTGGTLETGYSAGSAGKAESYAILIGSYDGADAPQPRNFSGGKYGAVVGGLANENSADYGMIVGGRSNEISSGANNAAILGGFNNSISGDGSAGMALGSNLNVTGNNQIAVGRYNVPRTDTKFVVGHGDTDPNTGFVVRKNGFEVFNTGQVRFAEYGLAQGGSNEPFPQIGNSFSVAAIGRLDGKLAQLTTQQVAELPRFMESEAVNISSNGGFVQLTNIVKDLVLATTSGPGWLGTVRISTTTPANRVFTVINDLPVSNTSTILVNLSGVNYATLTAGQSATFWMGGIGSAIRVIATNT